VGGVIGLEGFFFLFGGEDSTPFFWAKRLTCLVLGCEGSEMVTFRLELVFGFGGA